MTIKSFRQAKNLSGRTIFLRVDFNVPIKGGKILDDARITAVLPDILFLLDHHCKVILATHLGRPCLVAGKATEKTVKAYSTRPVALFLSKFLKRPVKFLEIDFPQTVLKSKKSKTVKTSKAAITALTITAAQEKIVQAQPGSLFFLENLRFNSGEQKNDKRFAKQLASLADVYVNDAFAVCHRADASVAAIKKYLPSYAGGLLEKEVVNLGKIFRPQRPLVAIVGGAKISTKISLLKNLLKTSSQVLIGGALASEFLAAQKIRVGRSLLDKADIKLAGVLLKKFGRKIILPVDAVTATNLKKTGELTAKSIIKIRKINEIKAGEAIMDIGPETISLFAKYIKIAQTLVWNGPLGLFEVPNFRHGTVIIARLFAIRSGGRAYGVAGGGETLEAIKMSKMGEYIDWVSTGGGAMLAFLGKESLPGLQGLVK